MKSLSEQKQLWWYSARLSHPDPLTKGENLRRARIRFARLQSLWDIKHPERVLWAPWLALAEADVPESQAWMVIEASIPICAGLVADLDGLPMSSGMAREGGLAKASGIPVEAIP